ncbi:MAG: AraC family transcriptional regulator [Gammaproteobacteria bacterium]|nr:MAG: AraC family transcriptional regulator [Gammaproteobacteria bacterium]
MHWLIFKTTCFVSLSHPKIYITLLAMQDLIRTIAATSLSTQERPFAIYACKQRQHLRSVPLLKPILVLILKGEKQLGDDPAISCKEGQFVFIPATPDITLSNIPSSQGFMSLFIEFDPSELDCSHLLPQDRNSASLKALVESSHPTPEYFIGEQNSALVQCATQLVEWSTQAPKEMWGLRRKELIQLLYLQGYRYVHSVAQQSKINHKLVDLFRDNPSLRWNIQDVSQALAMSESTLRRKLQAEGTNFSDLLRRVRLGYGMHLLQTTRLPIATISEQCGYQSQSRFTEKFKDRFGLTPIKLKQTHLTA